MSGKEYIRVQKRTARKAFEEGTTVYLLPCRCVFTDPDKNDDFVWIKPFAASVFDYEDDDFDNVVNAYAYYNCNAETGKYPHYYIERRES